MTAIVYKSIVFLPLLSAVLLLLAGRRMGEKLSAWVAAAFLFVPVVFSWIVFFLHKPLAAITNGEEVTALLRDGNGLKQHIFPLSDWLSLTSLHFSWNLLFDSLTLVMLLVVTSVSFLVHVYSKDYMHGDKNFSRFLAYLGFFTFAMLMLVSASDLVQLFFGWEGVGLASYLLIGFWHERPTARAAAIKAFLINRVGDIGFALGIFAIYQLTGAVDFATIFSRLAQHQNDVFTILGVNIHAITLICLLLFMGAMGKSAQLGLHTWLPDAMEGPTPVSALIHAATMVTAGVFMVARLSPLFELSPLALQVIIWVGACTAFFAGSVGLTQNDIKRVIAYSTCSQLGFMFVALGFSAYPAAIFHLTTHAFFKALLFLGAGSVIHGLSGEQDLRRMGGVGRFMPLTRFFMWVGSLSLIGFPYLSGYWSKDLIVEAAYIGSNLAGGATSSIPFYLLVITCAFTSFYSCRLLFLAFHGTSRSDKTTLAHLHESGPVILWPLAILTVGAVFAGYYFDPLLIGHLSAPFWQGALAQNDIMEKLEQTPSLVKMLPTIMMALGLVLAFLFYIVAPRHLPHLAATIAKPFYLLSYHKWWFDELYHYLFVMPARFLGRVCWRLGDMGTIDNIGPHFIRLASLGLSRATRAAQTGFLYHYLLVLVVGVMTLLAYLVLKNY